MINHIEINVKDLKKSKKFYTFLLQELGYTLFQEWEKGFSLKLDGLYIVFVQTENQYLAEPYHRKHIGLNHIAFSVANPQKVDELRIKLLEMEAPELYTPNYSFAGGKNHYAAFFEDPDRLKIELVAMK